MSRILSRHRGVKLFHLNRGNRVSLPRLAHLLLLLFHLKQKLDIRVLNRLK
jgi:hypothetical protein